MKKAAAFSRSSGGEYPDKLAALLWHTIENSQQTDQVIQLLKDNVAAINTLNADNERRHNELRTTLLQTSSRTTDMQPNISPVNSVNLQIYEAERPSPKLQQALDWLAANPSRADEKSRVLAAEIGVSHMTVAKAQQLIKTG